ncbi:hypothetical protein PILCRDRAFT_804089 [Piloderma croceum F 1598]|uniref:Uncharacterized protein n=1 Tax=Piloderma croceum (strain F 1598) TaxID=765440 RepID=A0A0C3EW67_PILCF|nr:hypothetical protein PILCRDRAFT_804089 [Piloderma croceum F 1598]
MASRRKGNRRLQIHTVDDVAASVDLEEGWVNKFLELPGDELAKVLGDIANHGKIKTAAIRKARSSLPSFSGPRLTDFAGRFGLPNSLENTEFEPVVTPVYNLPPSVHEIMFEAAWHTLDVYQEKHKHMGEVTMVRILDPYIVRIIGLFQGRIIDKPEHAMLETEYSIGDEVEHKIFMIGGILFFIGKFKRDVLLEENMAQLFVQILSGAKANTRVDFANLRIYGLLTDLTQFRFYSYDPLSQNFAIDEILIVNSTRDFVFADMIPVSNKIFSVILTAYIDGLEATMTKSIEKKNKGDIYSPGSVPLQQLHSQNPPSEPGLSQRPDHNGKRKLTNGYEVALQLAKQCHEKFDESVTTINDIEKNSTAALELLARR